jgi:hypothetical protein
MNGQTEEPTQVKDPEFHNSIITHSEIYPGDGVMPHPTFLTEKLYVYEDMYLFCEKMYRTDPLVSAAVDHLVNFTIQSGYRILFETNPEIAEKLEFWLRWKHFLPLLEGHLRDLYLMGTSYIWLDFRQKTGKRGRPRLSNPTTVTGWKVLHPAYMFVKKDEYGDVVGYIQRITALDKHWAFFKPEEIIHTNYRLIADRTYGTGLIETIIRDMHYERYSEYTLAEIFHEYLAPLFHIMCGLESAPGGGQRPASQDSIDSVRDYINSLAPNEDLVTDNSVKIDVLSPGSSIGLVFWRN